MCSESALKSTGSRHSRGAGNTLAGAKAKGSQACSTKSSRQRSSGADRRVGLALTLIAGSLPTLVGAGLLLAYLVLVAAIARNIDISTLVEALPSRRVPELEPSEVAREAMARARTHPDYDALVRLLDIGLIVDEPRPDGLSLRRGRFISLDDDGLRPFAIVNVPELLANRVGRVRFELRDESGKRRHYEADKGLQTGENAILPDYRCDPP